MKHPKRGSSKNIPIYVRPHSVQISPDEYLAQFASKSAAKKRLFNVGAGSWGHPFWTNIDLPPQTEAFAAIQTPCIHHDLVGKKELPIKSRSVDCFYTSHVVEHLPEEAVLRLMREVYRCLDTGGTFRIVTGPCADLDWQALMRKDSEWWFWLDEPSFVSAITKGKSSMTIYDKWLYEVATARSVYSDTPCEKKFTSTEIARLVAKHKKDPRPLRDFLTDGLKFNYMSPGDHISWWNAEKLTIFLKKAGFKHVFRSGYGQSGSRFMRDLRYFDQTYPQMSVYVEAFK